jgi:hypothetical protein
MITVVLLSIRERIVELDLALIDAAQVLNGVSRWEKLTQLPICLQRREGE